MEKKKARRKQNIPKDENKSQRFVRVVSPRVDKTVKAIAQIGLCTGSTYEYTPAQAKDILLALDKSFQSLKAQFEKKAAAVSGFSFSS